MMNSKLKRNIFDARSKYISEVDKVPKALDDVLAGSLYSFQMLKGWYGD